MINDEILIITAVETPEAVANLDEILTVEGLDGIFIGATRTADMRNAMIVSFCIYLGAWWLLWGPLENHGLWIAFLLFFMARGVTLGVRYPALLRSVTEA